MLILSIGYYTKVETTFFRYDFVEKLKRIEEPPGGNVKIISNHIPGYPRYWEINYYFYKAYGKASWHGETVRSDEENSKINTDRLEMIFTHCIRGLLFSDIHRKRSDNIMMKSWSI